MVRGPHHSTEKSKAMTSHPPPPSLGEGVAAMQDSSRPAPEGFHGTKGPRPARSFQSPRNSRWSNAI